MTPAILPEVSATGHEIATQRAVVGDAALAPWAGAHWIGPGPRLSAMTKRTRLLLAGAVVMLLAFIPGSAGADTVVDDGGPAGGGCGEAGVEAPASLS